jgi:hypothetical protein
MLFGYCKSMGKISRRWRFEMQKQRQQDTRTLEEFREIGETFLYMGRTCCVVSHSVYAGTQGLIPGLRYQYTDNNGVIRDQTVFMPDVHGLISRCEVEEAERDNIHEPLSIEQMVADFREEDFYAGPPIRGTAP